MRSIRLHLLYIFAAFDLFCWQVNSQSLVFSKTSVPPPGSVRQRRNAYYIFGENKEFFFPLESQNQRATVRIKNLFLNVSDKSEVEQVSVINEDENKNFGDSFGVNNASPYSVELILISYKQLKRMIQEYQIKPLCCRFKSSTLKVPFLPTKDCPYPGAVRRSYLRNEDEENSDIETIKDIFYVIPLDVNRKSEEDTTEIEFTIKKSGIYFFAVSNCGESTDLTIDGEITVQNAFGYLPGYEYTNFVFYMFSTIIYALICIVWGCCLVHQRANLISFHKCLGIIAFLGVLESFFKFWNLYYWNTHPSKSLVLFISSIFLSVLKSISSYILVLLGSLGWSITKPSLERRTIIKIQIIIFLYVILDTTRQVSEESNNSSGSSSLLRFLLILLPISTLNIIVFYWIISSLHGNIELLTREKQHEKLLMYRRLFFLLFGTLLIATLLLIVQIYVASSDPSDRLAFFTEIGDNDEMDAERVTGTKMAEEMQVWGEELEFQDHFSDEDFDGGVTSLKLDGNIPTFTSYPVRKSDNTVYRNCEEDFSHSLANNPAITTIGRPADWKPIKGNMEVITQESVVEMHQQPHDIDAGRDTIQLNDAYIIGRPQIDEDENENGSKVE